MTRAHSDKWLGLTESKSTIVDDFRSLLCQWLAATDKANGREILNAKDRASIRDSVRWGVRWLNEMKRAIDLGLPKAAIECATKICGLHLELLHYIDVVPEHNRMVPMAQRGERQLSVLQANNDARSQRNTRIYDRCMELKNDGLPMTKRGGVYSTTASEFDLDASQIRRIFTAEKKARLK